MIHMFYFKPTSGSERRWNLIVLALALSLVSGRRTNQSTLSCVHLCTPIADRQYPLALLRGRTVGSPLT